MRRITLIVAVLFAIALAPACAAELITDFDSHIQVAPTGVVTVTESITVNSAGAQIRHGILRDFPTTYTDRHGVQTHVGFHVISVSRDGREEHYSVEAIEAGERVRIGDPAVELVPGKHNFTLSYTTDRQIGFFPNYDELYWNVTGNFWTFGIDHAKATIDLPAGARIMQSAFYTGPAGATDKNASGKQISDTEITFVTTRPLGPAEGLTVAVGFSKNVVMPPSSTQQGANFLRDNARLIVPVAGMVLLLGYFMGVWYAHGRAPARGTIIPRFGPPQDLSPAAVRFVHRMAYDRKSYAAALIDMAVKGYLRVGETDHTYMLTRTGKAEDEVGLAQCEAQLAGKLFSAGSSIEMKQSNHDQIAQSITALRKDLVTEYEPAYFVTNGAWFFGGIAILLVTMAATALLCDPPFVAAFLLIWLSGWSFGTSRIVHFAWNAWRAAFLDPGHRIRKIFVAAVASLLSIILVVGWVFIAILITLLISMVAVLALSAGSVASYVFYRLLKVPTLKGAKARDEIDGFRLFLVTAEKDRLEALNPPDVTPQVFERFLPYAIALDCENQWSEKFEAEAAAAGKTPETRGRDYTPGWYSGRSFDASSAAVFVSALGVSIAAAAAAAASAPGSTSGSEGGGSSGGGGGGGGGSGW